MPRKPKHVRIREWNALFVRARDALAAAAAATEQSQDPDEIRAAWRHARDVQREIRASLDEATWLSAEDRAKRATALINAEALCDKALAQLQTDIPYLSEA